MAHTPPPERAQTLTDHLATKLTPACDATMRKRVNDAQAGVGCL